MMNNIRYPTLLLGVLSVLLLASLSSAWTVTPTFQHRQRHAAATTTALSMAIDYNDPVVAEEFTKVQPMSFEEVEEELQEKGIPVSPTMNEMDVKLMLVEMRLRFSGKLGGNKDKPKQKPTKFSNKFEEAMWTKPAFKEYYESLRKKDDHNAMNVASEYVNDPALANQRYGKDYKAVIRKVNNALTAPPPVNTPTLTFAGFPANMGEMGCRMTLESIGAITDFECTQDEDFPVLRGKVTFEDIESAKKAVAQYNGMNMGMGTTLELTSV